MSNPNPETTGVIKVKKLNILRSLCGAKIEEERKAGYKYLDPLEEEKENDIIVGELVFHDKHLDYLKEDELHQEKLVISTSFMDMW